MNEKEEKKRTAYYDDDFSLPSECDALCRFRGCYHKSENKGTFSQGRGYTSYHDKFYSACGTRLNNGCPPGARETYRLKAALDFLQNNTRSRKAKERAAASQVVAEMIRIENGKE